MTTSFNELGLIPAILNTLAELDHIEPTPIQAESIPALLAGHDVLGQAQTGTGKTAAFTLPLVQQLDEDGLQMLVLTPTRELAMQVADMVHRYGGKLGLRVLPIYGGQSYERQERRLRKGVQVVVSTPGRTLDLIQKRILDLSSVRFVVLDEADEMLKMGFIEDVEAILSATNQEQRQTALFSATLSSGIRKLAQKYMNDPLHIAIKSDEATAENVRQRYYLMRESDKIAALSRLLEVEDLKNTLIFTRTKVSSSQLAETLLARGYPAAAINGDLAQNERERILNRFRTGNLRILVATDVVARGVDIPDVSHVINFDIPQGSTDYVHRIGRTGRAGRSGDAITFISPKQRWLLKQIERDTRKPITQSELPSREEVLRQRDQEFITQLTDKIESTNSLDESLHILTEQGYSAEEIATGVIQLLREQEGQRPLEDIRPVHDRKMQSEPRKSRKGRKNGKGRRNEPGMVALYMNVGRSNGIRPADIVRGIASNANIPGKVIGAINIQQNKTYVDVPEDHVEAVLRGTQRGKLKGRPMKLMRA